MKKFFSLVLALVMALSLTTVAFGATTVTNLAGLQDAIDDGETDITLNAAIVVDGTTVTIDPDTPVTITTSVVDAFTAKNGGTLTLGEGVTIVASTNAPIWAEGGNIIIDGAKITSSAPYVAACAKNGGTITVEDGSVITVTSTSLSANAVGAVGANAKVTINGGELTAVNTVAYASEGGEVIVNDGSLTSSNGYIALVAAKNGKSSGGKVTVNGGTVAGVKAHEDASSTAVITGGNITGPVSTDDSATMTISGGTFATAPADEYLDGVVLTKDTNGNYVAGTEVTFGDKFDLYLANAGMNAALKAKTPTVADLSFEEVGAKKNTDGSGRVAYIAANNGQFFVKTTNPTVADYAVTYAGKTDVLYYITVAGTDAANFYYDEEVKAFNSWGLKCGQYNNTGWTAAQKAEDYFMASDKVIYMADDAGVAGNYLLDGVVVNGVALDMTKYVDHNFVASNFKYDAATGANVPTSALCTTCAMNTSAIYKIGKAPANSIVKPLYVNGVASDVWEVAVGSTASAPVVAPSTGTVVESAQTFDAGIAMYVGMSVMAACGSAVVLKKKD